jgi:hypothetical protein
VIKDLENVFCWLDINFIISLVCALSKLEERGLKQEVVRDLG